MGAVCELRLRTKVLTCFIQRCSRQQMQRERQCRKLPISEPSPARMRTADGCTSAIRYTQQTGVSRQRAARGRRQKMACTASEFSRQIWYSVLKTIPKRRNSLSQLVGFGTIRE